ncbi:MAG: hypothetical protein ACRDV2_12985, partial [Actinomycetes bacterium]
SIPRQWLPVGIQHAVILSPPDGSPSDRAICGTDVRGWAILADVAYVGTSRAACMRCTQMIPQLIPGPR